MQSEKIELLTAALIKAQREMGGAVKKSDNPYFKSKYADLATVQAVCEKPLDDNGLVITQGGGVGEHGHYIFTQLTHISGQWMRSEIPLILAAQTPQGVGSAITYFRRYGLAAMLNITQEDDDGNAASKSFTQVAREEAKDNGQKEGAVSMQKAGLQRENSIIEFIDSGLFTDAELNKVLGKYRVPKARDLSKDVADAIIAACVAKDKKLKMGE